MNRTFLTFASILFVLLLAGCASTEIGSGSASYDENYYPARQIFDCVYDVGTYTEADESGSYSYLDELYDHYTVGGCTAVAKTTDTEGTMVGRNLDIYISNYPYYFFRTERPGLNRTMGLTFTLWDCPDENEVSTKGVPEYFWKRIPFIATDVMNEHGLYVEINMRAGEYNEDGSLVFGCSGTRSSKGLDSELRLCTSALPFYLGEHCRNVEEVLDYVFNRLDLYTPASDTDIPWNFCFMIADASGEYGLLEIADEKVIFTKGSTGNSDSGKTIMQPGSAQANFYIAPELRAKQKFPIGLGRYSVVQEQWKNIETENDMFALMTSISYFQSYFPWCSYDASSENLSTVISDPELLRRLGMEEQYLNVAWDLDFIQAHPDYLQAYEKYNADEILKAIADGTIADNPYYWYSAYSVVANCSRRTFFLRFFEDNAKLVSFSFE